MRRLHRQFAEQDSAKIVIVYQKEPHAGQLGYRNISQPETFQARCDMAAKMKDEFEMPMDVLVDTMADNSRALFSDLPSPVYILDAGGIVRAKFPWPDQEQIRQAVDALQSGEQR